MISDKIENVPFIHKDIELLKKFVEPSILPQELGGTIPTKDLIADIKEKLLRYRKEILIFDEFIVDVPESAMKWNTNSDDGVCGSFRKLNVD